VPLGYARLRRSFDLLEAASALATYKAIPENNQTQEFLLLFYLFMRDKLEIAQHSLSTRKLFMNNNLPRAIFCVLKFAISPWV